MNISRSSSRLVAALCAVALAMAACTSADSDDVWRPRRGGPRAESGSGADVEDGVTPKTTALGLPCAVNDVLVNRCQTCHGSQPTSGASAPLVTFDDLHADFGGRKVYELVQERVHAEAGRRMPPAAALAGAEMRAIDDWGASGAPRSSDACTAEPPPATRPFVCPDGGSTSVLRAARSFTWTSDGKPDKYVCFGVDEVVDQKRHVIALGPKIDNLAIVHHVLLFQAKEAMSNEPRECDAITSAGWKMITGWAPGGGNLELPPEAGFPEEKGTTHWVLQVHYNNARNLPNQVDNSGYQICSTPNLRPNDAGVLAFGSQKFTIPPRVASYTIRCDYELGARYRGVKFFGASPHMHTRGLAISTERIPGGTGAPEMIFEQKPFVFENQENFKLDHKAVAPGDVMRTRCTWKNPGDTAVTWGEGTGDEMCFNFLTYYPAIPDVSIGPIPLQTWVTPSVDLLGAKCTEEN